MRGDNMVCPVILTEEEEWIVATDATTGIASQGKNNKEALELYYEDVSSEERTVHPTMVTTNLPT